MLWFRGIDAIQRGRPDPADIRATPAAGVGGLHAATLSGAARTTSCRLIVEPFLPWTAVASRMGGLGTWRQSHAEGHERGEGIPTALLQALAHVPLTSQTRLSVSRAGRAAPRPHDVTLAAVRAAWEALQPGTSAMREHYEMVRPTHR